METLSPIIRYRLVASAAHALEPDGATTTEITVFSVDLDGETYGILLERDGRTARPMAAVPAGLADHINDTLLPALHQAAAVSALLDGLLLSGVFLPDTSHMLEVDEIARIGTATTEVIVRGVECHEVEVELTVRDDQNRVWYAAGLDERRLRDRTGDLAPDTLAPERGRTLLSRMVAPIVEERLMAMPW